MTSLAMRSRRVFATFCLAIGAACAASQIPWTDNQASEFTIGNGTSTPSSQALGQCDYVAIDAAHGKLYTTDRTNHRVLRFAFPVTSYSANAEAVFGQPDMTSTGANRNGTAAANTLNIPYGLAVSSSGDLWISDYGNNRIVKIPTAYSAANGAAATVVLGQTSFTATTAATTASGLNLPTALTFDAAGNLWLADTMNSRVLRFANSGSITTGTAAAQVIGQASFTAGSANRGAATPSASGLRTPYGIGVSGTTLWVTDSGNHRVLRYDNAAATGNGPAANGVLGQADFTSGAANRGGGIAANTLNFPAGLSGDAYGRLYLSDSFNNRLLIFNAAAAKSAGAAADQLLGGASMTVSGALVSNWSCAYDDTCHRLVVARGSTCLQYANLWTTVTTLASGQNPCAAGDAITFTATVATDPAGGDVPSGTVVFADRGVELGTAALDASGRATLNFAFTDEDAHPIVAQYGGSNSHRASTSATLNQIVGAFVPIPAIANVEKDDNGSDVVVYNGNEYGGVVYTGDYNNYALTAAYKFDLSAFTQSLGKAELKVYVADKSIATSDFTVELHGSTDDSWTETPAPATAPSRLNAATIGSFSTADYSVGEWITFDVTAFVQEQLADDDVATFAFVAPSAPTNDYLGIATWQNSSVAPVLKLFTITSYATWMGANFTVAERADPAISGATADPDGAGISNLLRYACDLPARGPVDAPTTASIDTATSPATAAFSFPMRAIATDLAYRVQCSTDLVNWTTVESHTADGTSGIVTTNVSAPVGATRFFVRLLVEATGS